MLRGKIKKAAFYKGLAILGGQLREAHLSVKVSMS